MNDTFDFIVSRAVARTRQLYQWTHQKVKKSNQNDLDNGLILLKGGDLTEELKEFGRLYRQQELSEYFEEEFFLTKKIIYVPK